jgi:hypothetical protein
VMSPIGAMQAARHDKQHSTGSIVPALAQNARTGHPEFRNGKEEHRKVGHPSTNTNCGIQRIALAAKGLVSFGVAGAKIGIADLSAAAAPATGGLSALGVAYGLIGASGNIAAGGTQLVGAATGQVQLANQGADVASTVTTVAGFTTLLATGGNMEQASFMAGAESLFTAGYNGGATGHVIDEAANSLQSALLSTELGSTILDTLGLSGTGGCIQ